LYFFRWPFCHNIIKLYFLQTTWLWELRLKIEFMSHFTWIIMTPFLVGSKLLYKIGHGVIFSKRRVSYHFKAYELRNLRAFEFFLIIDEIVLRSKCWNLKTTKFSLLETCFYFIFDSLFTNRVAWKGYVMTQKNNQENIKNVISPILQEIF